MRGAGLFNSVRCGHFFHGCLLLMNTFAVGCQGKHAELPTSPKSLTERDRPPVSSVKDIVPSGSQSVLAFTDITSESGVQFRYYGAPSDEQYMTEQNGGGIAVADFDRDGICDLYLSNGSHFEKESTSRDHVGAYYRGLNGFRFQESTRSANVIGVGHGMGSAAGDIDNDGFPELYQAYYGRSQLWRNMGDGTFDDMTVDSGVSGDLWSASAAFADVNRDGLLDLFVVTYVSWLPSDPPCKDPERPAVRRTCGPTDRQAQPDRLFINQGDGRFVDRAAELGVADPEDGKGLAVEILDLTDDGQLDIFIANDTTANRLFANSSAGVFEEIGMRAGVAVSSDGIRGASMGIGASDFNRDGRLDLVVTNFRNQVKDLYSNLGNGSFVTANTETGLDLLTRRYLSFGVVFQDFDLDGWPDLFIANGHIWDLTSLGPQYEYQMPASLLRSVEGKTFVDAGKTGGAYFQTKRLGRAVAYGDLDNDGDVDLVIQHIDSDAVVLRNDSVAAASGCRLRFVGVSSVREPLGCRVEAFVGGKTHALHVPSGGSFQANHDTRVIVPVAEGEALTEVSLIWPSGVRETWNVSDDSGPEIVCIEGRGVRSSK